MSSANLPVLNQLQVASPCDASWEEMKGDDRQRFCGHCQKNVYNLPLLSPEELLALIEKTEGDFCGQLYARDDGRVLTEDCPLGLADKLRRARRKSAGAAASVAALVASAAWAIGYGWGGGAPRPMMGDISVPQEVIPEVAPPVVTAQPAKEEPPAPPEKPRPLLRGKIRVRAPARK